MIQRTLRVGAAAIVATLSGCGTAPASLHPMTQPTSLQLQAPVKWTSLVTDFDADGLPLRDKLVAHRGLDGRPDAAPKVSALDPNAPPMPAATVAGAGHGIGTNAAGSALGTGLVAGFIAADLGTYHDVDAQPPAGWLQAAVVAKTTN